MRRNISVLCNKNLSVCVICKESCEKLASVVMKWRHPTHIHCLEDFVNISNEDKKKVETVLVE